MGGNSTIEPFSRWRFIACRPVLVRRRATPPGAAADLPRLDTAEQHQKEMHQ